jgi:hypothetical protein
LADYAFVLAVLLLVKHFNEDAALLAVGALVLPLLPGMMPGGLMSIVLAFLGFQSFGFHCARFDVFPLISAPVINTGFAYIYIKRKSVTKRI